MFISFLKKSGIIQKREEVNTMDRWQIARRIFWLVGFLPMAIVLTVFGAFLFVLLFWLPFFGGLDFLIFKMMRWDHEWNQLIKKWEDDVRRYN